MRYLLEQPSFGVDGDVPPDALDLRRGRGGRDDREEDEDFAVGEEEKRDEDDVKLKAGDWCDFEEHNHHHQATNNQVRAPAT